MGPNLLILQQVGICDYVDLVGQQHQICASGIGRVSLPPVSITAAISEDRRRESLSPLVYPTQSANYRPASRMPNMQRHVPTRTLWRAISRRITRPSHLELPSVQERQRQCKLSLLELWAITRLRLRKIDDIMSSGPASAAAPSSI